MGQQVCDSPQIMFGLPRVFPCFSRFLFQRSFIASPHNIAASLEPVVEQPRGLAPAGAFHSSLSMCTHLDSISDVCGYSSRSIRFLSMHSAISLCTCGSDHVWQNVARFCRELPSSSSSSCTSW